MSTGPQAMLASLQTRWDDAAQDLRTLAWLHAAERDSGTWIAMLNAGFPAGLTLPGGAALASALADLRDSGLEQPQRTDDLLAADYAGIYLTHALRASPFESVWRDEDHLMLQGATFAVRAFYQRYQMTVPDWRAMPEDHLTHELSFIAHLLEQAELAAALHFMDQHLMTWLDLFCERVEARSGTTIYAGLALATRLACHFLQTALRDELQCT